jgi:hypothetical protein
MVKSFEKCVNWYSRDRMSDSIIHNLYFDLDKRRLLEIYLIPEFKRIFFNNSTHRHEKLHHIHHNVKRIENRSSCHNKFYRSSNQTACQPTKFGNFDTRNKLHANAYLCSSNPVEIGKKICVKIQEVEGYFEFNYLWVNADNFTALFTGVGEDTFVAFDAIRMFISQHITLSSKGFVALPAAKMSWMPVFWHSFCVFTTEN